MANLSKKLVVLLAVLSGSPPALSQLLTIDADAEVSSVATAPNPIFVDANGTSTYQVPVQFRIQYTNPYPQNVNYFSHLFTSQTSLLAEMGYVSPLSSGKFFRSGLPGLAHSMTFDVDVFQGLAFNSPIVLEETTTTSVDEILLDIDSRINGNLPFNKLNVKNFYESAAHAAADSLTGGIISLGGGEQYISSEFNMTEVQYDNWHSSFNTGLRTGVKAASDAAIERLFAIPHPIRKVRIGEDNPGKGTIENVLDGLPTGLQNAVVTIAENTDLSFDSAGATAIGATMLRNQQLPTWYDLKNAVKVNASYSVPLIDFQVNSVNVKGSLYGNVTGITVDNIHGASVGGALSIWTPPGQASRIKLDAVFQQNLNAFGNPNGGNQMFGVQATFGF